MTRAFICLVVLLLSGCDYERLKVDPRGRGREPGGPAVSIEQKATYQWIQQNVLPACKGCHKEGASNGVEMHSYNALMDCVKPGRPDESDFYTSISSTPHRMPKRGPKLSQDKIDAVKAWILKGAPAT